MGTGGKTRLRVRGARKSRTARIAGGVAGRVLAAMRKRFCISSMTSSLRAIGHDNG